ncbi:MAG: transketolase subunit [Clostridiales bacterium]|nr:transketolase subunit [Clostridiales bacterium]
MKPYNKETIAFLEEKANCIRKDIIHMISKAGAGHPGGSLSASDIVSALYFHVMNIDTKDPKWEDRDRFILSKGHACPVWYAALAEKGYFGMEHLDTLRKMHSILQGHPDMNKTVGIDMTAGSLGNGLSAGLGITLSGMRLGKDYRVYVMLGDGEIQEGMVWEAAMAAAHYKAKNLTAIIDNNGLQVDGFTKDVMDVGQIAKKFEAFGWSTIEIDGHNMEEILKAFAFVEKSEVPVAIVANTVKGKGVSFMENVGVWHGQAPNKEQTVEAMNELNKVGV